MKRTWKRFASLCLAGAVAITLASCGGSEKPAENTKGDEAEVIMLGGIGPMTGQNAMYGISCYNGANLAVEEINAKGGVLGKQIKLDIMDDKGDAVESVSAFNKLTEQGIVALIGAVTSKPSDAVAQAAVETGIPVITPTGTAQSITTHGENIFRAPFIDPYQGIVMAQYAKDELKASKVAVIKNNSSDYSDGLATAFVEKSKELGLDVVAEEAYGDTDVDFKTQLTSIAQVAPDVLFMPDYYQKIALIAPQARQAGLTATLIGGDGWDGVIQSINKDNISSIEGAYFANTFSLDDKEEKVQSFIANYSEKYGEKPQSFSALGYDSVYLIADAIEKAGTTESDKVVEAMKSTQYSGVTGSFKFDENRDPIKSVFMTTIKDGNYKLEKKFSAE